MNTYDSTTDTLTHIKAVNRLMHFAVKELLDRASQHDVSKLSDEEKPIFDEFTPKLKGCTYGSDEYKGYLQNMKVALDHHYAENSHHPEHYGEEGIAGMGLLDIVEMFFDWVAASKRHADGDIMKSIDINEKRFKIDPQLVAIFRNTAEMYL
jgi:hypothetical protein